MKPIQQNIELMREDSGIYVFSAVKGNYTGRTNYVTIKKDKVITGDRLVEKSSSADQVTAVYNSSRNETTFSFNYLPEDTGDLNEDQYVYDISSINPEDPSDIKTPKWGYLKLLGDVRNALNGFALPTGAKRFQQVDASNAGNLELNIVKTVNGVKVYEFIPLTELAGYLKPILDNL
jgi:hypothetical protein